MLSREAAKRLVPKANLNIKVLFPYPFTTGNIIDVVKYTDKEATKYDYSALAAHFKADNDLVTLKNVYDFFKYNILYVGDKPKKEYVKLLHSLIEIGEGDCKSFSVGIASILRTLGYTCFYRFAAYERNDFEHVYVVCQIRDQQGLKYIVMDAVPGGGFITEVKYKKKFDMEPEGVAMISGKKYELPFFDYHQNTDGEFGVQLEIEYAKMLLFHHPNNRKAKIWQKDIIGMENAIFSGIHGRNPKIAGMSYEARAAIERAKRLTQPASGDLIVLANRKSIGDGLIPLGDTNSCKENSNTSSNGYWSTSENRWINGSNSSGQSAAYVECFNKIGRDNEMKNGLNQYLDKFAARYIYHFEDGKSLFDNSGVSFETKTKITEHRRLFNDMVDVTKLGYGNMEMWSKLAVGKQTSDRGHGVLTPEYGIQLFKDNPDMGLYDLDEKRIGEPLTITVAICYAIIIAVSGSVAAAMVQVCQKKEPTALGYVEKIIGAGWGAKGKDWQKTGGNTGGGGNNNPPIPPIPPIPPAKTPTFWEQYKKPILITAGVTGAVGAGLLIKNSNS